MPNKVYQMLVFPILFAAAVYEAAYCPSYCSASGYFRNSFNCATHCCGSATYRYCCTNSSLSIDGIYHDVFICPKSSWWVLHWEIIVGMLGSLAIILLMAACCCQCCAGIGKPRSRPNNNYSGNGEENDDGMTPGVDNLAFDPSSQNAFIPPPYEAVSKDPPKYSEIFGNGSVESSNQAVPPVELPLTDTPPLEGGSEPPLVSNNQAAVSHGQTGSMTTSFVCDEVGKANNSQSSSTNQNIPPQPEMNRNSNDTPSTSQSHPVGGATVGSTSGTILVQNANHSVDNVVVQNL